MKKILIGFVMLLLAVSAWAYIPPANLTVSGEGLSITGGTQAVNGTGTNITISKVASADYSTSAGSAGTASTAGYASTAGAASTALTAGVAAYAVLTGTASSTAHATTADYSLLTSVSSSCSGNANTVTNGIYTSNTYSNPSWLPSVSYAVLSGTATSAGTANYATLTGTASTCSGNASNITGTLAVANGGTNITTYATGDVLYASSSTALSKLKIGSAGYGMVSRGGIPSWEAAAGSGTVTQVNTGAGLTGGPITTTGTISIDTTANQTFYTATQSHLSFVRASRATELTGISSLTQISFDSTDYDYLSEWNGSTFTAAAAGLYEASFQAYVGAMALSSYAFIRIYVNDVLSSDFAVRAGATSGSGSGFTSKTFPLSAGGTIKFYLSPGSSNQEIYGDSSKADSFITIRRVN